MDWIGNLAINLVIVIVVFLVMTLVATFVVKRLKNSSYRILNPEEFLPRDEIHTLKQLFFLSMMTFCFISIFYSLIFVNVDLFSFAVFDVLLSLYIAMNLDNDKIWKKAIFFLLLVPYGCLNYLLFNFTLIGYFDIIHITVFVYFIKFYYDKFNDFTNSNGLGVAIILLFSIIFISFMVTQFVEHVNPLDSMVMVSNAFTSNGYTVLGNSTVGKINSIFLVWGGYIISGVGTATLTAAILLKRFNRKLDELESIMEEEGESDE